jgi:hypothetical protein
MGEEERKQKREMGDEGEAKKGERKLNEEKGEMKLTGEEEKYQSAKGWKGEANNPMRPEKGDTPEKGLLPKRG